jgi:hypothetical protein
MPALRSKLVVATMGLALSCSVASPGFAAGGLFDAIGALFSRPEPSYAPMQPDSGPLNVTVSPRRRRVMAPQKRLRALAAKPKPPVVQLDPANDPTWHLKDPTLRRGDIVVLKSGVVVFDGASRAEHTAEEFTPLGRAPLLSAARRQEIAEMAAGFKAPGAPKTDIATSRRAKRAEANAAH